MKMRAQVAGLLVIALLALAGPAAASGDGPALGVEAAQSGPKDYSRNSVTGEFTGPKDAAAAEYRRRRAAGTSSLAGTTSADHSQPVSVDDPWPELAIGFVAGCLVAGAAALVAHRTRRARVAV